MKNGALILLFIMLTLDGSSTFQITPLPSYRTCVLHSTSGPQPDEPQSLPQSLPVAQDVAAPIEYPMLCVDHGLLRSGIAFTSRGIGFDDVGIIRHNSTAEYENIDDDEEKKVGDENPLLELDAVIAEALAEIDTDPSPNPSQPTPILPMKIDSPLTAQIVKYARLLSVKTVVVGLPLFKDGGESKQSRIVRQYCEVDLKRSLCREFGGTFDAAGAFAPAVRLYLFDERYSSSEAAALISSSSGSNRPVTVDLDAVSACVILSHFCKVNGKGAEEVTFSSNDEVPSLLEDFKVKRAERVALMERRKNMSTLKESRKEMISRLENDNQGQTDKEISSKKKKKRRKK
ncbi:hypothetical protein TrVE_jg6231 [Triparma verrucosa]|uniref:Uncharacterized protein n=1 Tax=Triparma verrucosa TaxID=1606542 RepID=A0A9W7C1K1_9STRA|nr:hypothetical protein TrVE_jg6231 [Triparma verrucosa]